MYYNNTTKLDSFSRQVLDKYGIEECEQAHLCMQAGILFAIDTMELPAKSVLAMDDAYIAYIEAGF